METKVEELECTRCGIGFPSVEMVENWTGEKFCSADCLDWFHIESTER